ncbi:hypothetical protein MAR_024818 [Mya arenaria]|uniref:Uncharacterized protein n=1 Tax=Mya arenaria TaxID=6604 RepID=A0ABY7DZV1_MYAAR|nr:hypothetical protein MAR_024818 [Mya arenaria]
MTCEVSKYDIAALMALIDMIRINWTDRLEMYKLLLALLADYNPTVHGNREKTVRYLRLLISDKRDACEYTKHSHQEEAEQQVKPAAESEKCPSNNEDQSPPDSTEEEFPQPEVVLAGSVVSKTCQIPDQMQAEPITASKHQVYQQQVNPKAVEGTCQQASSNYVSMMSQLPFPYQHHIYPTAPGQLVAYPHMITNCTGPPLPWRPVPFLQTCAQSGPQVGAVATSESESLLDLSLKPALKDRLTEVDSEIKTSTSGVMRRASDTDLVSFDGENMDLRKWTVANSSLTSEQGRITPRISEASIASTHWQTPMSIEKLELVPKPQLSIPTAEHTFSKQIQQSELGFTQPNSFFPDMPLTRSLSLGHLEASHIFSEPSSGTSSVHLSPYLLGMLPDKMTDSDIDSDDVFMS